MAEKLEPVAYLRAKDGIPQWGEDCVCQDPVYPSDPDGSDADCTSLPLVTFESAMSYAEQRLESIAAQLRKAGAKLPVDNKGTIESAMNTGLSIALCLIEEAIRALADKKGEMSNG